MIFRRGITAWLTVFIFGCLAGDAAHGQDDTFPDDLVVEEDSTYWVRESQFKGLSDFLGKHKKGISDFLLTYHSPASHVSIVIGKYAPIGIPSEFKNYSDATPPPKTVTQYRVEVCPIRYVGISYSSPPPKAQYTAYTYGGIPGFGHGIRHLLTYSPGYKAGIIVKPFHFNHFELVGGAGIQHVKVHFQSEVAYSPNLHGAGDLIYSLSESTVSSRQKYQLLGLDVILLKYATLQLRWEKTRVPGIEIGPETIIRRLISQGKTFDYPWASYDGYEIKTKTVGLFNINLSINLY